MRALLKVIASSIAHFAQAKKMSALLFRRALKERGGEENRM
jgi:hypothetical protein